jgi:hypothetical protein
MEKIEKSIAFILMAMIFVSSILIFGYNVLKNEEIQNGEFFFCLGVVFLLGGYRLTRLAYKELKQTKK